MPPKNLLRLRRYNDMSANHKNPTKVVTGVVRLSYANVWEPVSINGSNPSTAFPSSSRRPTPRPSMPSTPPWTPPSRTEPPSSAVRFPTRPRLKLPLRDGDLERDDEALQGAPTSSTPTAPPRPRSWTAPCSPSWTAPRSTPAATPVCPSTSTPSTPMAIAASPAVLGNIQKVRDGEPLGGRSSAADDFATDVDDDFLS